jgi:hypothetical protein
MSILRYLAGSREVWKGEDCEGEEWVRVWKNRYVSGKIQPETLISISSRDGMEWYGSVWYGMV